MLEVIPLREALEVLKQLYPDGRKIAVLSELSLSEKNNTALLDTLYTNMGFSPQYHLVDSFITWKEEFVNASKTCDFIYLPTNGGIKAWNKKEAITFVGENISVPVFTCDDFMMPYCVFGLTKIASEQGVWVAQTIKMVLKGTPVKSIELTRNAGYNVWINHKNSERIGFNASSEIFQKAIKY
jgi:ABC-type uncharacterized transport system substrate-binding protein